MSGYPVIFRCSECTIELPTLELLESHIWSRHLHNFPFSCAICRFPAIARTSLAAHFKQAHPPGQPVEFQRKMMDEVRLRDIIANSIVVPVYEEDVIYEAAPSQETADERERDVAIQSLDAHSRDNKDVHKMVAGNGQPLEIIDVTETDGDMQLTVVNNANSSVGIPLMGQDIALGNEMINNLEIFVPSENRYEKVGVFQNDTEADITVVDEGAILEEQHITRGSQVVHIDEDGATYFYDGEETGELLVDGASFDYQNVEGNSIYIEDSIPSTSKANNDVRMRLAKQRHIDFVVNKVARRSNGRTRRPLTIYECEDCGKIIRYPSKIEEHRRSHNGVKPHECPQCGQRFAQKGGLTCHMRLHTGERPFHCTWDCGKSFHSSSALKMHEKTHNGDRPYSCELCGKLFSKRWHCQRHEASVHPRETARRAAHQFGLAAAGEDVDRLRDVVNGVIEEVRIERSLRSELKMDLD
ncbi:hypothetical protein Q1695_008406 [Nippostrongylus brasiliensis]|nr:hypothetical protein Q1695_008406 [Nippostrongylus brasiliensis]